MTLDEAKTYIDRNRKTLQAAFKTASDNKRWIDFIRLEEVLNKILDVQELLVEALQRQEPLR